MERGKDRTTTKIETSEGNVWMMEHNATPFGVVGKRDSLYGIFLDNGKPLLPCIFDGLTIPLLFEYSGILQYKGFLYCYYMSKRKADADDYTTECHAEGDRSSFSFFCDNRVYSIGQMGYNNDGVILRGGWSFRYKNEYPVDRWSCNDKESAMKNAKELFGIIKSIHPICFVGNKA